MLGGLNMLMQGSRIVVLSLMAAGGLMLCSCGGSGGGGNTVPDSATIELPDGTTQVVTLGAGVPSLANSTWEFYATASTAQSAPFLVISFGDNGNLERFDDNTISPEVFGDTIYFDGARHSTNQQGVSYEAGTYGAETSDATGFAFEGVLTAFAAGIKVAEADAGASGEFDAGDPNEMRGTFSIQMEVTANFLPPSSMDETFGFVAYRIEE